MTTFAQAEAALKRYIPEGPIGGFYNLDIITRLAAFVGDPQNRLRVIHVAGTSGKTSTSYYSSALLRAAGYTVGLIVSPHIDHINERVQINNVGLPEPEFAAELGEFLQLVEKSGLQPTYFEILVVFAYWVFDKKAVDYAVIEVGLGGLHDGTNIVRRVDKVCVITDIGMDHVDILGHTIEEIAAQKVGIIHPHNHVYMNVQSPEIMDVIRRTADEKSAHLHVVSSPRSDPSLPIFQQRNLGLAIQAVEHVLKRSLSDDEITQATRTYIPARMEIIKKGQQTIIIDGAHNEQKMSALVQAMQQAYPDQPIAVMAGFGMNKESSVLASLRHLRQISHTIVVTEFRKGQDERRKSIPTEQLAEYALQSGFNSVFSAADSRDAFGHLLGQGTDIALVTGSFYLAIEVRSHLSDANTLKG